MVGGGFDFDIKYDSMISCDVDSDWMSASVMCHDIRVHLYWHMQDMILYNRDVPTVTEDETDTR